MQTIRFSLIILFSALILQCGTTTKYLDASKAEGSREWGPKEIKLTVDKMVAGLYQELKNKKQAAFLDVARIRNRTSEHIDTKLLANELTTSLIRRRIKFINRADRSAALKEIEMGQTGVIDADAAISAGNLKSPNYLLSGDVTDNVRSVDGNRVQYLVVTLKLTRLSTTEIVWQEQQQFLKSSKEDKITW